MSNDNLTLQRAVASGVSFNIGLLSSKFDVIPARRENLGKDVETHYVCPEQHDTPARVKVRYLCDQGHTHDENELVTAYFGTEGDSDKIVPLTKDDLADLRCGALDEKNVDLYVHPIAEVEGLTAPDESLYRIRPPKGAGTKQREIYSLLLAMAADPKFALVGELRFRGGRKLYRLRVFRGQLTLQSLIHPHDLAPLDDIDAPDVAKGLTAQAKLLLERSVTPFDPARYGHNSTAALGEILAKREAEPIAAVVPINAEASDLMARLEASVKTARKVATPSRTARKSSARSKKQAPAKRARTKAG
jgi:non-homologous end joining protein Ku